MRELTPKQKLIEEMIRGVTLDARNNGFVGIEAEALHRQLTRETYAKLKEVWRLRQQERLKEDT